MEILIYVIIGIVALGAGFMLSKMIQGQTAGRRRQEAEKEAERIIETAKKEGETLKKDKMLEAKETFIQKKGEYEELVKQKEQTLNSREKNIHSKENSLNQQKENYKRKEKELDSIRDNLNHQLELIGIRKAEVDKQHSEHVRRLEKLAKITAEEAKQELIESLKEEARTASMSISREIIEEAKVRANKEARRIVLQTIQRTAAEHAIENSVTTFNLESDDIKGQIIGREGRNIRALEAATGVELIVDDTPEAVIISGFDPVRREIARIALQRLVADGRIHPARIEEIVAKTKRQIEEQIMEIGERTVIDLGIHGMNKELIKYVGRMRFRSSYGQNLLQHSREVANLCATMAAELGLNVKLSKRAGLLHDIGKVPEDDSETSHALLGMKLCEKYGEHAAVCNAVGAHHDEVEMTYIISPIIQACDAISGARPGARRETMESYLKRIKELETLAMSYDGVEKAYAMQAGRELRVIVESESVSDQNADDLSYAISEKIQNEMQYPGQIKVTVIRERRAVSYAK